MSEESKTPDCGKEPTKKTPEKAVRPASPQPSTSTSSATTPSTSSGSPRPSVYSHIDGIDDIQPLRQFRPGRRRGICEYRLLGKAKLARQYEQAIRVLAPIFAEETRRQEEVETLVVSGIENFANTLTSLVDQLEGKPPSFANEYAAKNNLLKRLQQKEINKRKFEHPEEFEDKEPKPKLDDEEEVKYLIAEIEAAITAITTGNKDKEKFPSAFSPGQVENLRDIVLGKRKTPLSPQEEEPSTSSRDKRSLSPDNKPCCSKSHLTPRDK